LQNSVSFLGDLTGDASDMRVWFIITTVDVLASPNNREHHLVEHLAERFDKVFVIFRRRASRVSLWRSFIDALLPYSVVQQKKHVTYVAVNHPLNHFHGLTRTVLPERSASGHKSSRFAETVGGLIGIGKDVATVIALAGFAWFHRPRGKGVICTAMGPWAAGAARILRWLGAINCVVYEDRDYEPGFVSSPLRRRWTQWMENAGIKRSDACISIGLRLANLRLTECQRRPTVIPTGVRYGEFQQRRPTLRQPILGYTGNVADWAQLDLAVAAIAAIRTQIPEARLEILGSGLGEAVERVKVASRAHDMESCVTIIPPRDNHGVSAFLARVAVGYALSERLPLRIYAAPLKVPEYMAAGIPVLATAGTEAGDLVASCGCGFAIEPNPDAIVDAALRLLSDPELAVSMGTKGMVAAAGLDWALLMEREWAAMRRAWNTAARGKDNRRPLVKLI
jgi:glycosyltransferase involved in cell wall biosynthesis